MNGANHEKTGYLPTITSYGMYWNLKPDLPKFQQSNDVAKIVCMLRSYISGLASI